MLSVEYRVPENGLGTDFTTNERPISFASVYTNRFRNVTGGAERRPGMNQFGTPVSGGPNLTRLHEFVDVQGNETLMVSDDSGNIWKYGIIVSGGLTGGVGTMAIINAGTSGHFESTAGNAIYVNVPNTSSLLHPIGGAWGSPDTTLEVLYTATSGQITSLGPVTVPGSGFSVGNQFTYTFFTNADNILEITSIVNTSAQSDQSGWISILTGKNQSRMISAQSNGKLIFCNGVDRPFYTNDAGQTFNELKALIADGIEGDGSNATTLIDANITNWVAQTEVANNDIIYNVTLNAYGIVSTVASAALTHTAIGSAATGAGNASRNQQGGDSYQLIDYVNMEVIPNGAGGFTNTGTATNGTSSIVVAVSGVNFSQIQTAAADQVRSGDFIYNTTQGAIGIIGSVSANINITTPISGQSSGDSIALFKSAMPIPSWIHVHYGRCYYLDSRNQTDIIISAPDDPQDVTTFQQTLAATSLSFGSDQPSGDTILSMTSFQRFFVASGKKNLYIYQGVNPIQDTSSTTIDFAPISFYPNGVVTPYGLTTNGTDLLHLTKDGLQAVNIGTVTNTTIQNNVSMPIRETLSNLIANTNESQVQVAFYSRRNWLIVKIGDSCYILNAYPSYTQDGQQQTKLSWHLFNGPWAQQNHYFVRRSGDLYSCGPNGLVYQMDSSATDDNGTIIQTDLVMAWLRLEEPQHTIRIKQGFYIRPIFESDPTIEYTINANAGLDNFSSDSITVSAGGTGQIGSFVIGTTPIGAGGFAQTQKYPLRWRGEQVQIEFTSETSASPDIITSFTIFGDVGGRR